MNETYVVTPPPIPLRRGTKGEELTDSQILDDLAENLERMNFIAWYRNATPEDMELARKNNSEKLDELMERYKYDVAFLAIQYERRLIWGSGE